MSETEKKKVSPEFIHAVKKYIEVDDNLKDIKERMKTLNVTKKEKEEYILNYLQAIEENIIDIQDGKLKRNISKTQGPLKKELIQKTLTEIVGDASKASAITDKIIESRPVIEKITLRRTKTKLKDI
jgi:hypothetical protein